MKSDERFSDSSDRQLVRRAKEGGEAEFRELMQRYEPLIRRLVNGRIDGKCFTESDRSDLYQELLLTMHKAMMSFDDEQERVTFGLYLKICMTNRLNSKRRDRLRTIATEERLRESALRQAHEHDEAEGSRAMRLAACDVDLGLLSEFEKLVYEMLKVGKSCPRIAAELSKPVKSVYNASARIKAKLRSDASSARENVGTKEKIIKNESVVRKNRSRKDKPSE